MRDIKGKWNDLIGWVLLVAWLATFYGGTFGVYWMTIAAGRTVQQLTGWPGWVAYGLGCPIGLMVGSVAYLILLHYLFTGRWAPKRSEALVEPLAPVTPVEPVVAAPVVSAACVIQTTPAPAGPSAEEVERLYRQAHALWKQGHLAEAARTLVPLAAVAAEGLAPLSRYVWEEFEALADKLREEHRPLARALYEMMIAQQEFELPFATAAGEARSGMANLSRLGAKMS